jgi:excisionase family DNA binding protein
MAIPSDLGIALSTVVEAVLTMLIARLRAAGIVTSSSASVSWYNQDSAPIARRTYLELCRSGRIESHRIGKSVLVQRDLLDLWIKTHRKARQAPARLLPPAPAETTNEELLRAAGVRLTPSSRGAARSSTAAPAAASPRGRRRRR